LSNVIKNLSDNPLVNFLVMVSGPMQLMFGVHGESNTVIIDFIKQNLYKIPGITIVETLFFKKC